VFSEDILGSIFKYLDELHHLVIVHIFTAKVSGLNHKPFLSFSLLKENFRENNEPWDSTQDLSQDATQ
jgi:hypothetical protein